MFSCRVKKNNGQANGCILNRMVQQCLGVARLSHTVQTRNNFTSFYRVVAWTMLEQHCYHAWVTLLNQQYCSALFEQHCYHAWVTLLDQQYCSALFEQHCYHAWVTLLDQQYCSALFEQHCYHAWVTLLDQRYCSTLFQQHCYHAWATLLDQQYFSALFQQYCWAMMKQRGCLWLLEMGNICIDRTYMFIIVNMPVSTC